MRALLKATITTLVSLVLLIMLSDSRQEFNTMTLIVILFEVFRGRFIAEGGAK